MKRIYLIIAIVAVAFAMAGCKKRDDVENKQERFENTVEMKRILQNAKFEGVDMDGNLRFTRENGKPMAVYVEGYTYINGAAPPDQGRQ